MTAIHKSAHRPAHREVAAFVMFLSLTLLGVCLIGLGLSGFTDRPDIAWAFGAGALVSFVVGLVASADVR